MNQEQVVDKYARILGIIGNQFLKDRISYDAYIRRTRKVTEVMDKKFKGANP